MEDNTHKSKVYLIYVDDCGKPLKTDINTTYYCLTGIIVCEREWQKIDGLIESLKLFHSIEEIHTRNISKRELEFSYLSEEGSNEILEDLFHLISSLNIVTISSVIDKRKFYFLYDTDDAEYRAWKHLFERCDLCIEKLCNSAGTDTCESGIMITDQHNSRPDEDRIRNYLKSLRLHGTGFQSINRIIEEPLFTPSHWRNFTQLADCIAYCTVMKIRKVPFFVEQFSKIQSKFDSDQNGNISGYGLKIFP